MPRLVIDSYNQHYFSGAQCRVYFDGVHAANISYIEFSLASNKAPIYSYNDPYYKMVARGNYMVQGNFAMNMTERGKLIKVGQDIQKQKMRPGSTYEMKGGRGVEGLLRFLDSSSVDKEELLRRYEEAYWGKVRPGPSRVQRLDEWDLLPNGDIDPLGMDIVMVYGVPAGPQNEFTVRQINDVHITGNSLVNNPDGNPIADQYSFFAREVDGKPTLYYEPETKLEAEPDVQEKEPVDLTGYPIQVTADSNTDGARWTANFRFTAGDPAVHIAGIGVAHPSDYESIYSKERTDQVLIPSRGGVIYGWDTSDTFGVAERLIEEGQMNPTVHNDTLPGTDGLYSVSELSLNLFYIELRDPYCILVHDGEDQRWTTSAMNFTESNGRAIKSGPIRVYRPRVGTEMPPKTPN